MTREEAIKRFQCISPIYYGMPLLRNQIVRDKLKKATCEELRDTCRLWNVNAEGLMDLLGV